MSVEHHPFVAFLEKHFEVFRDESDRLSPDDYARWPQTDAYQGAWLVFPLIAGEHGGELDADLARNRRLCPRSYEILRELPDLADAGFSRLQPNTHVYPHAETAESAGTRCHLGLRVPDGCLIRIDGAIGTWQEGRCRVFDGRLLHEAANLGTEPRTILLCDFDNGEDPR